jgi:hypothetical protein
MIVIESVPGGGWNVVTWAGTAIGGPRLDDGPADGPAGADPTGQDLAGEDPAGEAAIGSNGPGADGMAARSAV